MLPHGLLRGVVVVRNIDVGLPTPLVPDAHRHEDDEASYLQMIALSVMSLIIILVGLIFLLKSCFL